MTFDSAKGWVLVAAAAALGYAVYRTYKGVASTVGSATDLAGTIADKAKAAAQAVTAAGSTFVNNGKCGSCAAFPALCDTFSASWMTDCLYVPRDPKTLDRSQQTGPGTAADSPKFDPNSDTADTSFPDLSTPVTSPTDYGTFDPNSGSADTYFPMGVSA